MAEHSTIEWTGATWNPITGCSVLSPGCKRCYAMGLAGTRLKNHPSRAGLTQDTKAGPVWTGEVRFNEGWLDQPLRWKRPREIFVCAHSDLFHENVPFAWIDRIWAVMALADRHTFQVLTKRSARMREYLIDHSQARADGRGNALLALGYSGPMEAFMWPLPNVHLGVSVEDVERSARVLDLLETPAAVRWVSYEPALEYVDFRSLCTGHYFVDALAGLKYHDAPEDGPPGATAPCARLDQVVMGGESGRDARPMHPKWPRWTARACAETGTPFFFKQWGAWREAGPDDEFDTSRGRAGSPPALIVDPFDATVHCFLPDRPNPDLRVMLQVGKKAAGRLLDGVEHNGRPSLHTQGARA